MMMIPIIERLVGRKKLIHSRYKNDLIYYIHFLYSFYYNAPFSPKLFNLENDSHPRSHS